MAFNMNSGYSGWSMSNNAVVAYENDEIPKSKWTKTAMLSAISDYLDEEDRCLLADVDLNKMTKDEIFKKYFYNSSAHHTSKFANLTDFYSVDGDEIDQVSRKLTDEECEEKYKGEWEKFEKNQKEYKEFCERAEKERQKRRIKAKAFVEDWQVENNMPWVSLIGYQKRHPELNGFRIKKRNLLMSCYSRYGDAQKIEILVDPPGNNTALKNIYVHEFYLLFGLGQKDMANILYEPDCWAHNNAFSELEKEYLNYEGKIINEFISRNSGVSTEQYNISSVKERANEIKNELLGINKIAEMEEPQK